MIKVDSHKVLVELKGYVKKNWGFPFIAAFILLLPFAYFADSISVLAFYTLLAGVVLQFFCFLKCKESNASEVSNGPS